MADEIEDTVALTAADMAAIQRDTEEEDETGAPERVAWPEDEGHPLESADQLREPPYERNEDVGGSEGATPDLEDRVQGTP